MVCSVFISVFILWNEGCYNYLLFISINCEMYEINAQLVRLYLNLNTIHTSLQWQTLSSRVNSIAELLAIVLAYRNLHTRKMQTPELPPPNILFRCVCLEPRFRLCSLIEVSHKAILLQFCSTQRLVKDDFIFNITGSLRQYKSFKHNAKLITKTKFRLFSYGHF